MHQEAQEPGRTALGSPALPAALCNALRTYACDSKAEKKELCGLVVDLPDCWKLVETENVSPDPYSAFAVEGEELLKLWKLYGDNIVGMYHTHPGDTITPSDIDVAMSPGEELRYWIATVHGVYEYDMMENPPREVHRWIHVGG